MALMESVREVELPVQTVTYGPWLGSVRSVTGDQVPVEYVASIDGTTPSNNQLYLPRTGTWKLRGGASEKFDTFNAEVGLLPAKWTNDPVTGAGHSRIRDWQEFLSDAIGTGIPTQVALLTRETVTTGYLDDGRFSNLWLRDQDNSLNYTLCSEYSTSTTYPSPGAVQSYRVTPLWYESGDGGITRGVTEFARRFFCCGSRRFLQSGNELYMPNRYGTPFRWRKRFASATVLSSGTMRPISDHTDGTWVNSVGNNTDMYSYIDEMTADDTDYITQVTTGQSSIFITNLTSVSAPTAGATHQLRLRVKRVAEGTGANTFNFDLQANGNAVVTTTGNVIGTSFQDITYTLSAAEIAVLTAQGYSNVDLLLHGSGSNGNGYFQVSYAALLIGGAVTQEDNAIYMFPTGPFPPCHAGSVSATAAVTPEYTYPDADSVDGSWLNSAGNNTNMFSYIDDAVGSTNDSDYITSNASNTACTILLATPSTVPTASDTVTIRYRNRNIVSSGHNNATIEFLMNGVSIASQFNQFNSTSSWSTYAMSLTEAEISNATTQDATWATAALRFTTSSESGLDQWQISQAYLERLPAAASSEGGWKGKDRFFRGFYYRYEDDSIWALTEPRFPNSNLTNGLDLVTVDSANPDISYTSITHVNIPVPPPGVKSVGLCRTDKIDSSVDDNLLLNPTGMKLIAEVPAGTTSYVDYKGDDAALTVDVEQYFIRYDHMMAPRSRYLFAGDMRACASYGGTNPCAIVIAPTGRDADWDLNLPITTDSLYNQKSSYMRLDLSAAGVMTLTLLRDTGSATDSTTFTSTSYPTIQDLVDAVNNTSVAGNNKQWRAQLVEREIGSVATTSLCPHSRVIASCTVTGQTINKSAGGLSKVAVGAYISGTGVTAGAYVTHINSDMQLTFTGTIAAATVDLTFYFRLGDDPTSLSNSGYQRVIGNCLPGFLYFNKTYLDTDTFDKASTWMTVAQPGSVKAAPNAWSNRLANRFAPPLLAGICQGGAAVDQGFVVAYANKIGAIRPRGPDSLLDQDYTLVIIDESRGCCAWNTVTPGSRFVPFLSAEGMFVADLEDTRLISEAIYVDQPVARGDFTYEGPQSVAAAAADTDGSYAWARVLRGVLWVGYRTSSSTTHCDRRVRLDFTSGDEATGIRALFRRPGVLWGWSTPLLGASAAAGGSYNLMVEARRDDGFHLYGWHDTQGTTGDGRMDEVETGTTDNGTAITGRVEMPWLRPPEGGLISGQEFILEHNSPTGSTGSLVYHRTFSDDAYTLTPGTSSLGVYSEMKQLPFNSARTAANAAFVDYRQATGSAREIRKIVFKFKVVKRFKT